MHMERMYIHDSIYDEFRRRFVAATEKLTSLRGPTMNRTSAR